MSSDIRITVIAFDSLNYRVSKHVVDDAVARRVHIDVVPQRLDGTLIVSRVQIALDALVAPLTLYDRVQ